MSLIDVPRRSRGTAAVVLSRPDPQAPDQPGPATPDDGAYGTGWPRWFALTTAILLGAALLAVWTLLLLGGAPA